MPPDPRTHLIVFLFGGPTMFGYGVEGEQTLASDFQTLLESTDSALPSAVYNFSQGNCYNPAELILFESLLNRGVIPDVVVFLDGLNEFCFQPVALSRVTRRSGVTYFARQLLHTLPMARAASSLRSFMSNSRSSTVSPDLDLRFAGETSRITIQKGSSTDTSPLKRMIEAVSGSCGIDAVFVWQPLPTYKYGAQYHHPLKLGACANDGAVATDLAVLSS